MLYVKILLLVLRASLYRGKNVDSGLKIWFVILVFLPIQITGILPDPKIFRYNGDFSRHIGVRYIGVPIYSKVSGLELVENVIRRYVQNL